MADDSDDELYEPLMDDNESSAISDLLVYLENVCIYPNGNT
jgi:hypothetical protein